MLPTDKYKSSISCQNSTALEIDFVGARATPRKASTALLIWALNTADIVVNFGRTFFSPVFLIQKK